MVEAAVKEKTGVIQLDALLAQATAEWKTHIAACHDYVQVKQPLYTAANSAAIEFTAYAQALTQMIRPYTFAKKPNAAFTDDGRSYAHNGRKQLNQSGSTHTEIGAIDYWAASMVDPAFGDLCRQQAKLADKASGMTNKDPFSLSGYLDIFSPELKAEDKSEPKPANEVRLTRGDAVRNALRKWSDTARAISHPFPLVYIGKLTNAELGAAYRLMAELEKRFKAMMEDPIKRKAVRTVVEAFGIKWYVQSQARNEKHELTRGISNSDPTHKTDALERRLTALAYLKLLGYETIPATSKTVDSAISAAMNKKEYANGKPAPAFAPRDGKDNLSTALERMMYGNGEGEMGLEKAPRGIDFSGGPGPVSFLEVYAYPQTPYVTDVKMDTIKVPEQAVDFGRQFLNEVRNLPEVKAVMPQPA